jgi:mannose-6-phosphate isomerase-like protein (cupin superfamily)
MLLYLQQHFCPQYNIMQSGNQRGFTKLKSEGDGLMDSQAIKEQIEIKVHHVPKERKVPMHKHPEQVELFYCFNGSGVGVLEDSEVALAVGEVFIAPAGAMHAMRSEECIDLISFLIPVINS